MSERSWMMGGGKMTIETDTEHGRAVGSHVRLRGAFLGIRLHVEAVVTRHETPKHKAWSTVGTPRVLVIGDYRMAIDLTESQSGCTLRVSIDYDPPATLLSRLLARLVGSWYARWCVRRMADDAVAHFAA